MAEQTDYDVWRRRLDSDPLLRIHVFLVGPKVATGLEEDILDELRSRETKDQELRGKLHKVLEDGVCCRCDFWRDMYFAERELARRRIGELKAQLGLGGRP